MDGLMVASVSVEKRDPINSVTRFAKGNSLAMACTFTSAGMLIRLVTLVVAVKGKAQRRQAPV